MALTPLLFALLITVYLQTMWHLLSRSSEQCSGSQVPFLCCEQPCLLARAALQAELYQRSRALSFSKYQVRNVPSQKLHLEASSKGLFLTHALPRRYAMSFPTYRVWRMEHPSTNTVYPGSLSFHIPSGFFVLTGQNRK